MWLLKHLSEDIKLLSRMLVPTRPEWNFQISFHRNSSEITTLFSQSKSDGIFKFKIAELCNANYVILQRPPRACVKAKIQGYNNRQFHVPLSIKFDHSRWWLTSVLNLQSIVEIVLKGPPTVETNLDRCIFGRWFRITPYDKGLKCSPGEILAKKLSWSLLG